MEDRAGGDRIMEEVTDADLIQLLTIVSSQTKAAGVNIQVVNFLDEQKVRIYPNETISDYGETGKG